VTKCGNCGAVTVAVDIGDHSHRLAVLKESGGPIREQDGRLGQSFTVSWVLESDDGLPEDSADWLMGLSDDH
jgi:hypothetical protein